MRHSVPDGKHGSAGDAPPVRGACGVAVTRRVLFTTHDAGGTVPPMLALAETYVARGDTVVVLSQPSVRARATAAGCTFVPFSELPDYAPRRAIEDQLDLSLRATTAQTIGDDVLAVAKEHASDLLVVDANLAGALAAAEQLDRPSAVLLHSMYTTFVTSWFADYWSFLEPGINETRDAFGLAPAHDWPGVFAGRAVGRSCGLARDACRLSFSSRWLPCSTLAWPSSARCLPPSSGRWHAVEAWSVPPRSCAVH